MRATVVLLSEIAAAGTMSPRDFLGDGTRSCALCGLTPASVESSRRTDPVTALLELDVDEMGQAGDQEGQMRCRNRDGCKRRQALAARTVPDA